MAHRPERGFLVLGLLLVALAASPALAQPEPTEPASEAGPTALNAREILAGLEEQDLWYGVYLNAANLGNFRFRVRRADGGLEVSVDARMEFGDEGEERSSIAVFGPGMDLESYSMDIRSSEGNQRIRMTARAGSRRAASTVLAQRSWCCAAKPIRHR